MQWQEPKSRRKSVGYMPMCFFGKAWEILAQALPVNACTATPPSCWQSNFSYSRAQMWHKQVVSLLKTDPRNSG